jgi:hypothetical protein
VSEVLWLNCGEPLPTGSVGDCTNVGQAARDYSVHHTMLFESVQIPGCHCERGRYASRSKVLGAAAQGIGGL